MKVDVRASLELCGYDSKCENLELGGNSAIIDSDGVLKKSRMICYVPLKNGEGLNYEIMRGFKIKK